MDIVAGITAATQAIGIAKALRSIEKNYDEATYKAQIADLINSLTDAKLALSDAKDGLAERDKEIERLKASFQQKAELVKGRGDYHYVSDGNGNPVGYPVCPKCEAVDGRIIQLKQDGGLIQARCPACATKYSPVTCYLAKREGAPETSEDADKIRRDAETVKMREHLKDLGSRLA